ncbi:MAG: FAD-binding protein [Oscillospiraceae bacterium]|nr:FAD-binding protein [Oscillospiraceae bacterium]MDE6657092.1 FAD-binding protein [Oscillospiraceae bacterium]
MSNHYDVIIAGGGAAGLYAAINLPKTAKVLLLTKREISLCNTALAQGGIAGVYQSPEDKTAWHEKDTYVAGGFQNNHETVHILVEEAKQDIGKIIELGVDFDKLDNGDYHRTLEGGHSKRRIFHHKDATGREIAEKLLAYVKKLDNIEICENTLLCDVKKSKTGFSALTLHENKYRTVHSHFFIMATGGIGRVYEFTTNSAIATGDGIMFACNMGAEIQGLQLIQFHPTAFNNRHTRECFLISEAVRGEGAYLLNCNSERFMQRYDDRLELAPRDVVSHAIILESRRTGSDEFYLDITHKNPEEVKNRFPMIYQNLLKQGYDMTKNKIPIYPCQHYLMGGIRVDSNSQTKIKNLYACGECSNTGVHGNNRLASNSLLEALVFSRHASQDIARKLPDMKNIFEEINFDLHEEAESVPHGIRTQLRHILQESYFVIPNAEKIQENFSKVCEILKDLEHENYRINADYVEVRSTATIAYLILKEAITEQKGV